jgi:hypothetical protein
MRIAVEPGEYPGESGTGVLNLDGARLRVSIDTGAKFAIGDGAQGKVDDAVFTHGAGEAKAKALKFAGFQGRNRVAELVGGKIAFGKPTDHVDEFAGDLAAGARSVVAGVHGSQAFGGGQGVVVGLEGDGEVEVANRFVQERPETALFHIGRGDCRMNHVASARRLPSDREAEPFQVAMDDGAGGEMCRDGWGERGDHDYVSRLRGKPVP